jgi:hypothetical protein
MARNSTGKPFRLLSMEGLFAAFALFSLGTGVWRGELLPIFWGGVILAGLGMLMLVRRRDWQKHWEELEKARNRYE